MSNTNYCKLFDKNVCTFGGFTLALKVVTMLLELLKTRSDGELVAHTHRYLREMVEVQDTSN